MFLYLKLWLIQYSKFQQNSESIVYGDISCDQLKLIQIVIYVGKSPG